VGDIYGQAANAGAAGITGSAGAWGAGLSGAGSSLLGGAAAAYGGGGGGGGGNQSPFGGWSPYQGSGGNVYTKGGSTYFAPGTF
jgi:hypothetical protein